MNFNYSVIIRTLGNTGEKYLKTLQAVAAQTVDPLEVIVVIPHGYELDHRLGFERIVRSDKGMVTQRVVGIDEAKGDYLLVMDDDIDLPPDFAEKMYRHLESNQLDCALAFPCASFHEGGSVRPKAIPSLFDRIHTTFTGQAFYSRRTSQYYDTIASTGGHRLFVNCKDRPCQTGCFQCFFIKTNAARKVHFEDERWLERGRLSSYAAYDDAVFFYKLYLMGGRMSYTQTTAYVHLDAAAGRQARSAIEARCVRLYSIARNRTIFWHKHIYSHHRSARTLLGGWYGIVNYAVYNILINILPSRWPAIRYLFKGYSEAYYCTKQPQ